MTSTSATRSMTLRIRWISPPGACFCQYLRTRLRRLCALPTYSDVAPGVLHQVDAGPVRELGEGGGEFGGHPTMLGQVRRFGRRRGGRPAAFAGTGTVAPRWPTRATIGTRSTAGSSRPEAPRDRGPPPVRRPRPGTPTAPGRGPTPAVARAGNPSSCPGGAPPASRSVSRPRSQVPSRGPSRGRRPRRRTCRPEPRPGRGRRARSVPRRSSTIASPGRSGRAAR